jgi:hypothetical protein
MKCVPVNGVPVISDGELDELLDFESFEFAEHVRYEPRSFKVVDSVGAMSVMFLMMLLRDRYFPTIWPKLLEGKT